MDAWRDESVKGKIEMFMFLSCMGLELGVGDMIFWDLTACLAIEVPLGL